MSILTFQVALYTLMLGERYGMQPSRGGLLFYLKGGHMQGLPSLPHELRGLLLYRPDISLMGWLCCFECIIIYDLKCC